MEKLVSDEHEPITTSHYRNVTPANIYNEQTEDILINVSSSSSEDITNKSIFDEVVKSFMNL